MAANSHAELANTMDNGHQVYSKQCEKKEKIIQGSFFLVSKILLNNHPNRGAIHFTSLQESVNIVMLCDHVLVIRFIMSIILS